jgi:transketolase C-terminal domain/subunit
MDENPDVYFLMAGLGYPRVDEFLEKYPTRAFNFEASEQSALDACVGLAYAG